MNEMSEHNKEVVLALAYCSSYFGQDCPKECPYYEKDFFGQHDCLCQLMNDAIDCIVGKGN